MSFLGICFLLFRSSLFLMMFFLALFWVDFFVNIGNHKTFFYFAFLFFFICLLFRLEVLWVSFGGRDGMLVAFVGIALACLPLLFLDLFYVRKIYIQNIFYFVVLFLMHNFLIKKFYDSGFVSVVPLALIAFFCFLSLFHFYGVKFVSARQSFLWNPHYLA